MPTKKKNAAKEKVPTTFVGVWQHEHDSDMVPIVGPYEAVLAHMVKRWKGVDGGFEYDPKRKDPFYVDPQSGYATDVSVYKKGGRIVHVAGPHGNGPIINIMRSKILGAS